MNKKTVIDSSIFRFIITGGCSTAIDFVVYSFLSRYIHVLIAKVISMLVSSVFAYFVNKIWTFKNEEDTSAKLLFKYYLTLAINISCNTTINYVCLLLMRSKNISFVIATGASMVVNYLLQHLWVFKVEKGQ